MRRPLNWAWILSALLACYWLALFIGTHYPKPPRLAGAHTDKVLHSCAFGGLAVLLCGPSHALPVAAAVLCRIAVTAGSLWLCGRAIADACGERLHGRRLAGRHGRRCARLRQLRDRDTKSIDCRANQPCPSSTPLTKVRRRIAARPVERSA